MGALISQKATVYRASTQTNVVRETIPGYYKPLEAFHYREHRQVQPQNRPARGSVLAPRGVFIRLNTAEQKSETRPLINRAAIALLRSWREEDPQQQRAVWDTLKQTLDEDRLSDRERVP